jgi:hypothetical protein
MRGVRTSGEAQKEVAVSFPEDNRMRQQRLMVRVFLIVITAALFGALYLNIFPGGWDNFLLIVVVAAIFLSLTPVALLTLVFIVVKLARQQGRLSELPLREAAAVALFAVVTAGMVFFEVPQRVAFALSRSAFDKACKSAPEGRHELHSRFGIYQVDEYAKDPRGGVFFRTHACPDGWSPDTMSYGFVYQPNQIGTPFGAAHYEVYHMIGDWYCFQVSDDWYR